MKKLTIFALVASAAALCAPGCGDTPVVDTQTDGGTTPKDAAADAPVVAETFTVGGQVTGLAGTGLVLQNNAGDDLVVKSGGAFTFIGKIAKGKAFAVTVKAQPTGPAQVCTVTAGSGTVTGNVTTVAVACVTSKFTVGGTLTGLTGTGLVLQNNAGDDLTLAADGKFTFAAPQDDRTPFAVTIKTQPTSGVGVADQTCVVAGGTGTVAGGNVTSVTINCSTKKFTIGGTTVGLAGSGLVLQNNAGDDLAVNAAGQFAFATPIDDQANYAVTVKTQPTNKWQTCVVTNGTGKVAKAAVSNVTVTCTTNKYLIKGNVTGLDGAGLKLQNNAGDDFAIAASGAFTFVTSIESGAAYAVTVLANPTNKSQTCVVTKGAGNVAGADVTDVAVACTTNSYTVGGNVTGLVGTVVLTNNGGDDKSVAANGAFTFATQVASGGAYAVAVKTQPGGGMTCAVTKASGTVTNAAISDVTVTCSTCGNDCWGATGCMTAGGRCVKLSCRPGNADGTYCDSCGGWAEITRQQWTEGGVAQDVTAKYRATDGTTTRCGGNAAQTCCGNAACAAGGDNAWHFFDPRDNQTYYQGPCLGCANDNNPLYWNNPTGGQTYPRITACIKK